MVADHLKIRKQRLVQEFVAVYLQAYHRYLGGETSNILYFSPLFWGQISNVDHHIFQMGWQVQPLGIQLMLQIYELESEGTGGNRKCGFSFLK